MSCMALHFDLTTGRHGVLSLCFSSLELHLWFTPRLLCNSNYNFEVLPGAQEVGGQQGNTWASWFKWNFIYKGLRSWSQSAELL